MCPRHEMNLNDLNGFCEPGLEKYSYVMGLVFVYNRWCGFILVLAAFLFVCLFFKDK